MADDACGARQALVFRVSGARRAVCWIEGLARPLVEVQSAAPIPEALFGAHLFAPLCAWVAEEAASISPPSSVLGVASLTVRRTAPSVPADAPRP